MLNTVVLFTYLDVRARLSYFFHASREVEKRNSQISWNYAHMKYDMTTVAKQLLNLNLGNGEEVIEICLLNRQCVESLLTIVVSENKCNMCHKPLRCNI